LGCGVNAAVYLVGMDQFGSARHGAGARYGAGYCDAQCTKKLKFVDGTMNLDWTRGSCCAEIDLFEGNKYSQRMTLHPCDSHRATCTGETCESFCDKNGCSLNGYKLGAPNFYSPGGDILDSLKPFTLVTQFITEDGTDRGRLVQVSRFFLQEGRRYEAMSPELGMSTSDEFCAEQLGAFNQFTAKNGMYKLGEALDRGMVLALSIWEDPETQMRWLDSDGNGPCPNTLTNEEIREASAHSAATYANFRYGTLGSTQNEVLMKAQIPDVPVVSLVEREFGVVPLGAVAAVLASLAAVAGLRWQHTSSRGLPRQPEEEVDPFVKLAGEVQ